MNWGQRLALALTCFIGFILFMVISSHSIESDLETEDYYEQEITYQDRIDAKANTASLEDVFTVDQSEEFIAISFPEDFKEGVSGQVHLFRPNNADLDLKLSIPDNSKHISIPKSKIKTGQYELKITCDVQGSQYYFEQDITVK